MKLTTLQEKILPGDRVLVFDHLLYENDKRTPLHSTVRPATVVCRYGCRVKAIDQDGYWEYPDMVAVIFDHKPGYISRGHFTDGVKIIL